MTIQLTSSATDNTAIIRKALNDAGQADLITIRGSWCEVSAPIDITTHKKSIRIEVLADLKFAGNGFIVGNTTTVNNYIRQEVETFGPLYGPNEGTGYATFEPCIALLIKNSFGGRYKIGCADGWKTAIRVEASGLAYNGSLHNHIHFTVLERNALNIELACTGNKANFVNQNYFHGGTMAGKYGGKFTRNPGQLDPFNGNSFYGCGTENIEGICWNVDYAENNKWYDGRATIAENPKSSHRFKFSPTARYNRVTGYALNSGDVDDFNALNDFSQSTIFKR